MRFLIIGFLLWSSILLAAYRLEPELKIYYGSAPLRLQYSPVSVADVVYVPLSECAKQLGLEVVREGERIKVSRAADQQQIWFSLNSRTVKINAQTDELSDPLLVIRETPYIALGEFVWLFGYFAERLENKIILATKIEAITFDKQVLTLKGQAPLSASIAPSSKGYVVTIENCILGRGQQEQEILVEDGAIVRIVPQQSSLSPAVVQVLIETNQQVGYTLLKEAAENAIKVRFDYKVQISSAPSSAKTVIKKTINSKILWLPEQKLGAMSKIRLVLKGISYPAIPLKYLQGHLFVPFDDVFGALGCALTVQPGRLLITDPAKNNYTVVQGRITGPGLDEEFLTETVQDKVYVPLVQLLRIVGYAAYEEQQIVYINPVISSIEYDAGQAKLLIKANDRLNPKALQYLKRTAVLDIPFASYNCTQNIYRTLAPAVAQVRVAQFTQGTVRVAMDIPSTQNKPIVSYENNGQWLAILFKGTALKNISLFTDRQNNMRLYFSGATTLNGYTVSRLNAPDRLLIDFSNTVLNMPNHLEVAKGPVQRLRLSQFTLAPQVARVVLDLGPAYRGYSVAKDGALFIYSKPGLTGTPKPSSTASIRPAKTTTSVKVEPQVTNKAGAEVATDNYIAQTYAFVEKVIPVIREATQEKEPAQAGPKAIQATPVQPIRTSLQGLRVAIIPGHGGSDAGAISRTGYMEKYPTLEVAKKLQGLLIDAGAIPLLCRESDENVTLEQQAAFANRNKADILISIHFNSFVNSSVGGAESYYYKPIDYALANAVHEEILKIRHVRNKGLKKACMHNLNHTSMPGTLIEPLFISNRQEELLIKDPNYQLELAKAILRGIEKYQRTK